jgi:two-component system sensor histidine kinase AgrC
VGKINPLLAVATILLETLFIAIINLQVCISQDINTLKNYLPYANILVIVLSGFAIISIRHIADYTRREMEVTLLKEHLRHVEDLVNSLHSERHEHTRHLQTIQAMLYLEETDEAKKYLEGIANDYWQMQDLVYVGNPALTALLSAKRKVAEVKNIDFACAVKCNISNLGLEPWDLCSIVGNLLDNALEAVLQEDNTRRVSLEIKYEDNCYVIYVYNNGPRIPKSQAARIFHPGYTTKNSAARGFGLFVVKTLVDKYGGSIQLVTEPRTTFIIKLPDREVKKLDKAIIQSNGNSYGHTSAIQ